MPDLTFVFDALKESWKNSGYYLYTLDADIWKYASPVSDRTPISLKINAMNDKNDDFLLD